MWVSLIAWLLMQVVKKQVKKRKWSHYSLYIINCFKISLQRIRGMSLCPRKDFSDYYNYLTTKPPSYTPSVTCQMDCREDSPKIRNYHPIHG